MVLIDLQSFAIARACSSHHHWNRRRRLRIACNPRSPTIPQHRATKQQRVAGVITSTHVNDRTLAKTVALVCNTNSRDEHKICHNSMYVFALVFFCCISRVLTVRARARFAHPKEEQCGILLCYVLCYVYQNLHFPTNICCTDRVLIFSNIAAHSITNHFWWGMRAFATRKSWIIFALATELARALARSSAQAPARQLDRRWNPNRTSW